MTRYAKFKGNTHRQENEATSWKEQLSAAKQIDKAKVERSEKRRLKRQEDKKGGFSVVFDSMNVFLAKMVCFNCRRPGHTIHECPEKTKGMEDNIKNRVCFVCGKPGHRAAQCSHNPRGLYPDGGGCKFCGDVTHLYAACPKKLGGDFLTSIHFYVIFQEKKRRKLKKVAWQRLTLC